MPGEYPFVWEFLKIDIESWTEPPKAVHDAVYPHTESTLLCVALRGSPRCGGTAERTTGTGRGGGFHAEITPV